MSVDKHTGLKHMGQCGLETAQDVIEYTVYVKVENLMQLYYPNLKNMGLKTAVL